MGVWICSLRPRGTVPRLRAVNHSIVILVCRGVRWTGPRTVSGFVSVVTRLTGHSQSLPTNGGAMGTGLAALTLVVIFVMACAVVLVLVRL
jgi:hypothetical protein